MVVPGRIFSLAVALPAFFMTLYVIWLGLSLGTTDGKGLFMLSSAASSSSSGVVIAFFALTYLFFISRFIYLLLPVKRRDHTLLTENKLGKIKITRPAMEELVYNIATQQFGVRSAHIKIFNINEAGRLTVQLEVTTHREGMLPRLGPQLQQTIQEVLEKVTGLPVEEVTVTATKVLVNKELPWDDKNKQRPRRRVL
ncbi:alkaline shock response membrane anchor protein AmaP [Heliorestis acidaminivorans]|nr:alkaline shock response membrane anchor protein AmaP [Heliorestis acidaminivorans]